MDISSMLNTDILDPEFMSSMMSIMSCMKDMSTDSKDLKQTDLPVSLNIDGLYSGKSLEFLFSAVSDGLIDKILDVFNRGDFNSVIELCKKFANMLNQMGVGNGIFQGEISNRVVHVIQSSINSTKFNKTYIKCSLFSLISSLICFCPPSNDNKIIRGKNIANIDSRTPNLISLQNGAGK